MPRVCSLALLFLTTSAVAVPMQFPHQGRLLDSATGQPLDGPHTVTFTLFDAASSGTSLWTEDASLVFEDGYYTHVLGDDTANPLQQAMLEGGDVFLSLAVDAGPELPDRLPLRSVPFAVLANQADTATNVSGGIVDASEIRVNGTTVIDASGSVTTVVDWSNITNRPVTIGETTCAVGEALTWDGLDWGCDSLPHVHDATDLTTGTIDINRLPVGSSSTTVAPGDHLHTTADVVSGVFHFDRMPVGTTVDSVAAGAHSHVFADITDPIDAASLGGVDPTGYAASGHAHAPGDADTLDGVDSTGFSAAGHGHAPGDAATLGGVAPAGYAVASHAHAAGDADTLDGVDSTGFATASHAHAAGDADTLDGIDSTGFLRDQNNTVDSANIADGTISTADLAAAVAQMLVPSGAVVAFNANSCPSGWTHANGSGGRPDLRGRLPMGTGVVPNSGSYNLALRATTGSAQVRSYVRENAFPCCAGDNGTVGAGIEFAGEGGSYAEGAGDTWSYRYGGWLRHLPPVAGVLWCVKN